MWDSGERRLWHGLLRHACRAWTWPARPAPPSSASIFPEEQDCRRDDKDNLPTHAWFTAFAPYENPEIAVVVFVYNGGEGSATAAPVAQKILQTYFTRDRTPTTGRAGSGAAALEEA